MYLQRKYSLGPSTIQLDKMSDLEGYFANNSSIHDYLYITCLDYIYYLKIKSCIIQFFSYLLYLEKIGPNAQSCTCPSILYSRLIVASRNYSYQPLVV